MVVSEKLLILWSFCGCLIIVALGIRFSKDIPHPTAFRPNQLAQVAPGYESAGSTASPLPTGPSESFYDYEISNQPTTPDTGPSTPPTPAIPSTDSDPSTSPATPTIPPTPTPPASPITARSYLVGNVETGEIYYERNSSLVLPVASMSKLITAIGATDKLSLNDPVTISPEAMNVEGDTSRLVVGEIFTAGELLYPMLLKSSNVAAEALASTANRAKFLELMSSYAWEVGMSSTYFADPSGLSPQNISTSRDFFALARYLYKSRPDILAITKTSQYNVATTTEHNAHQFVSIHPFIGDPNFLGGKTGHTPVAKDTLLTIMNIRGTPVAIIVLSSDNRKSDTAYLIGLIKTKLAR